MRQEKGDFKLRLAFSLLAAALLLTACTGPQGPAGPDGATGQNGAAGPAGTNGQPGATGSGGATGAQGPNGDLGAADPQGPQGKPGANGTNGAPGTPGPQGPAGDAYVQLFTFGPRLFSGNTSLEIPAFTRAQLDSSIMLAYGLLGMYWYTISGTYADVLTSSMFAVILDGNLLVTIQLRN